jgi:hypothetical protein
MPRTKANKDAPAKKTTAAQRKKSAWFEAEAKRLSQLRDEQIASGNKVSPLYGVGQGFLDNVATKYFTKKERDAFEKMTAQEREEQLAIKQRKLKPNQQTDVYEKLILEGGGKKIHDEVYADTEKMDKQVNDYITSGKVPKAPTKRRAYEGLAPDENLKDIEYEIKHAKDRDEMLNVKRKLMDERKYISTRKKNIDLHKRIAGTNALETANQNIQMAKSTTAPKRKRAPAKKKAPAQKEIEFLGLTKTSPKKRPAEYDADTDYDTDLQETETENSPPLKKKKKQGKLRRDPPRGPVYPVGKYPSRDPLKQKFNVQHPLLNETTRYKTPLLGTQGANVVDLKNGHLRKTNDAWWYANKYPTGYTA